MSINEKIQAVQEFQDYAAYFQQTRGVEATLADWREALERRMLTEALTLVKEIATEMLQDDFTRNYGDEILNAIGEGA